MASSSISHTTPESITQTTPANAAPPQKHILISGGKLSTHINVLPKLTQVSCPRHWPMFDSPFLQNGHKVFVLDLNETELKHTAESHLHEFLVNGALSYTVCNLRSIAEIREAAEKAAEFFDGKIDVLINNRGILSPYWKDGATIEDKSTILPYMKVPAVYEEHKKLNPGPSPCIIHVSSFRMLQSDPNQEGYASTKAGLLGLTHSMAVLLSEIGLRVNLIAPGRIKVAHESKEGDEEGIEWGLDEDDRTKHATNRAGKPEDIAECAEWLIGADFVNGQSITVDGGASITKNKK